MVDFVCFLLGCDMVLVTTIVIVVCSMHGCAICPFLGGWGWRFVESHCIELKFPKLSILISKSPMLSLEAKNIERI